MYVRRRDVDHAHNILRVIIKIEVSLSSVLRYDWCLNMF